MTFSLPFPSSLLKLPNMAGVTSTGKLDVLDVCPQLIPQDRSKRFYDGSITVCKRSFRISIKIPEGRGPKTMENARIECGWKLCQILQGYEGVIKQEEDDEEFLYVCALSSANVFPYALVLDVDLSWFLHQPINANVISFDQRLSQSADLPSFLLELKSILEKLLEYQKSEKVNTQPKVYTHLVAELEAIGWERLAYVDPSFQVLKLSARDNKEREHFITLHISAEHPYAAPTCTTDLPGKQFTFSWTPQSRPLQQLYHQFQEILCKFEDFWDMLDEIDYKTWILEPDQPRRSCTSRRIALGNNASIQIDLNPANPRLLPECRFLGADSVVVPLREHLNANIQSWNPQLSVFANLENLLGQKFPSPSTTKKEDFSMECGICYAYRLNDLIPDKVCDDSRCGQSFHSLCLYEWLRDLPSTRQSFNMVFGECPYCSKPITVKMVTGK